MTERKIADLDLRQIAESGQCFRMVQKRENVYALTAFGKYLEIEQNGDMFSFSCTEEAFGEIWEDYLDLHTDYGAIKRSVDAEDTYLLEAVREGWGIRILRQDLWEMIVTFILSQQSNIPRIKSMIQRISEWYGDKKETGEGHVYYAFPRA